MTCDTLIEARGFKQTYQKNEEGFMRNFALNARFAVANQWVLAILVSLGMVFSLSVGASAATYTWTGASNANKNFSNDANWQGGTAPTANGNHDLVFDKANYTGNQTPNNDLTSAKFNSIAYTGEYGKDVSIGGNAIDVATVDSKSSSLTFTSDLDISTALTLTNSGSNYGSINLDGELSLAQGMAMTNGVNTYISGGIIGSGDIVMSDGFTVIKGDTTFSGNVVLNGNSILQVEETNVLGDATGITTINGSSIIRWYSTPGDITEPMTFNSESTRAASFCFWIANSEVGCNKNITNVTSQVTLLKDTIFSIDKEGKTVNFTNLNKNGHKLTNPLENMGTITVNNVDITNYNFTIDGDKSDRFFSLNKGRNLQLNGIAGQIGVYGGRLTGNGAVKGDGQQYGLTGGIAVYEGVIAPGNSPGCMTADSIDFRTDTYSEGYTGGSLEIELAGTKVCEQYDQLIVNQEVKLINAKLNTILLDKYLPKKDDVFTIVDNKGSKAVEGTFKDLPEGATFEVNGVVFKISYVGGDGNDITLTAMNVPAAPKTGLQTKSNIATTLLVSTISAAAIVAAVASQHFYKLATNRVK